MNDPKRLQVVYVLSLLLNNTIKDIKLTGIKPISLRAHFRNTSLTDYPDLVEIVNKAEESLHHCGDILQIPRVQQDQDNNQIIINKLNDCLNEVKL